MKMPIKTLYVSDLDGTLLNSEKEISKYTEETINRLVAGGVHFSIATARTAASAVKMLSSLDINDPVVLMNGAVIYDLQLGRYEKVEVIPEQSCLDIINTFKSFGICGFMYIVSDNSLVTYYENLCTKALKDFHDERVKNYYKVFEQTSDFRSKISGNDVVYFNLIDTFDRLSHVLDALDSHTEIGKVLYKDIYAEDEWYLEVFSKNASKYNAVNYLRQHYGFDRVIGFGDNINDIPLFKACDEGYAVANALDQLKAIASGVIGDNNSDGVARYIAQREDRADLPE
jgi:hypothetical protein